MSTRPRVGFATNSAFRESPADDRLVFPALAARGIDAVPAVWDSPSVPWSEFEMVIVRSTWDYQYKDAEFLRWIDRVDGVTTLQNPAPLLRWNHDKRYLIELAQAGFDVVPTERIARGSSVTLAAVQQARGWGEVVVKPAVGAAGHGLRHVGPGPTAEGEAHLGHLLASGDALVQPFLAAARKRGERSLVFLDGKFSHAIAHQHVLSGDDKVPRPLTPSASELARAERIVAWLDPTPLYARLDFLPGEEDAWSLGELEVIEPELFFRCAAESPDRFAQVIAHRLAERPTRTP